MPKAVNPFLCFNSFQYDNQRSRIITLYGTWKIKKGIGLTFGIEYENKKNHAIIFAKLTLKDKIFFHLRNQHNKQIRELLKLIHKILKGDGEAFLQFLKSKGKPAVFISAGFKW